MQPIPPPRTELPAGPHIALWAGAAARARMPVAVQVLLLVLLAALPARLQAVLTLCPPLRRRVARARLRARLAHLPHGDAVALRLVRDWQLAGPPGLGLRPAAAPPPPWHPARPVRAPPGRPVPPSGARDRTPTAASPICASHPRTRGRWRMAYFIR